MVCKKFMLVLSLSVLFVYCPFSRLAAEEPDLGEETSLSDDTEALAAEEADAPAAEETEAPAAAETEAPAVEKVKASTPMAFTELDLFSDQILVMAATKRLQKLSEIPGSITVITGEEIHKKGALTLYEVLHNLAGIDYSWDGFYLVPRMRGLQNPFTQKILLLIDGRKINTLDFGYFSIDYGTLLDNVKHIEIIKGPGSALYGANAFAGVINIVTKTGGDLKGLETKVSIGNKSGDFEPSKYYRLAYGNKDNDFEYLVSAGYWRQFLEDPFNDKPNTLYDGHKADFSINYKDLLSLRGGYEKKRDAWPGAASVPTPDNYYQVENGYLDAKYNLVLDEISKLSFRAADTYSPRVVVASEVWDLDRKKICTLADLPTPAPLMIMTETGDILPISQAVNSYYITIDKFLNLMTNQAMTIEDISDGAANEFALDIQYDLSWPQDNYFLAGLSLRHDWSHQKFYAEETIADQSYAVFLQDELHVTDQLLLLGGVRYDYNEDYGANVSPRASAIYEPMKGLRAKLLYGTAFREPTLAERFTLTDYGFYEGTGNPDLKPEFIEQSEAIVEYELGKELWIKGGYFYYETENEIQFSYDYSPLYIYSPDLSYIDPMLPPMPGFFFTNLLNLAPAVVTWDNSTFRIGQGVETEALFQPLPFAALRLNYSHTSLYMLKGQRENTWAEGIHEVANAILELNYEKMIFLNFYARTGRSSVNIDAVRTGVTEATFERKDKWLKSYDVSIGGTYQGFSLVAVVFNVFENPLTYNTITDDYDTSYKRMVRVNAGYALTF
ncbi:TonB-dependent receptor [candidate division FCPU426 bacterium]|nr:TonB-dependent receptor [candidate division FCPU426 bacterium]